MSLPWRPRIVYAATELLLSLPQRPWTPVLQHVGGSNKAALGIRETYTIRHEDLHEIQLRVTEAEWPAVRHWLRWARGGGEFTLYPDRDTLASFLVDLESPGANEEVRPERTEYGSVFELTLTLRLLGGAEPGAYYP
jgi:hypothetical protein